MNNILRCKVMDLGLFRYLLRRTSVRRIHSVSLIWVPLPAIVLLATWCLWRTVFSQVISLYFSSDKKSDVYNNWQENDEQENAWEKIIFDCFLE